MGCGIVGIVRRGGISGNLGEILRICLKNLEYRGYDSVGIAVVTRDGRLVVRKARGKIDEVAAKLRFDEVDGDVGIGHTRWATHGRPDDINAHPHTDCSGRIAVAHNGIIENYRELRSWLESRGHRFVSQTDTEVIPHLIEEFKSWGFDPYTAFKKAVSVLRGAYAIVAIDLDEPGRIFFARHTSPLVIGFGEGFTFIASDIPAFLRYTRRVLVLHDGEVGFAEPGNVVVEELEPGIPSTDPPRTVVVDYTPRVRFVEWSAEAASKGGYPHYMLKEIIEQPQALAQTIAGLEAIDEAVKLIARASKVIFVAAGSSYHSSLIGMHALIELADVWSEAVIASEARWRLRALRGDEVVIAVSQSGETIDTLLAVREARKAGARVIAVSNVIDSAIPRESDFSIYTRAGPEIGVAATKTFTTQIATLVYLAACVGRYRGVLSEASFNEVVRELKRVPMMVERVLEKYSPLTQKLARDMVPKASAYYLGRGPGLAVAMEGALKMKEIAYLHAESYPAGESKHGPIALVEEGFPVVFVALGREDGLLIESNIEEMKARGAWVILVASRGAVENMDKVDVGIEIPRTVPLVASIPAIVPLQLLAYYTAVYRGHDPDKPRNLAKTVTVI